MNADHVTEIGERWAASESIQALIDVIGHIHEQLDQARQKLQDYENCKGIEDYYRVLSALRDMQEENGRLRQERDEWLRKAGANGRFYLEALAERDKVIAIARKLFKELGVTEDADS